MKLARGNSDFGAETKDASIVQTRGRVMQNRGRIDFVEKTFGVSRIFRNDAVGMARSVTIHMINGLIERIHHSNGNDEVLMVRQSSSVAGSAEGRIWRTASSPRISTLAVS